PPPRRLELLDLALDLGLEAYVGDRDTRRCGNRPDKLGIGVDGGVGHEHGDGFSCLTDGRHAAILILPRKLELAPSLVDERVAIGDAIAENERRVTQRAREAIAQRPGLASLAEIDDQTRDRGRDP